MEPKKYSLKEKIEAVGMLRESNFNFAAIADMLKVPEGTLHRWNDKHGPTVKDAIQEFQDPSVVVLSASNDVVQTNSAFLAQVNRVRTLALDRLELVIPGETDSKKLVDALKILSEITAMDSHKETGKGNYFLQIIEKQYISKHGNKISQPADPGDTA